MSLIGPSYRVWPALLPGLLFVPMILAPPVNHDVAAVLSFSERWLAGERLYVDLVDVNPPLIYVLNLLPAALGRVSGLGGVVALQACLIVLCFMLWRLTLSVRDRTGEGPVERVLLDALPGLVGFGAGYDFGQRDALMVMLALPYVLAAAQRLDGRVPRRALLAATVAAVGFALKPHFLAVPALVEGAVLVGGLYRRQGSAVLRDKVPWVMAVLWCGYLASLPLAFPEYLANVVPLALAYYLDIGSQTTWDLLAQPRLGTAVILFMPLVVLVLLQTAALPRVLALAGLAAIGAVLAQHKGWSYHILPIELFDCTLASVLAARWLDRLHVGATPAVAVGCAAWLASLFGLYLVAQGEAPWNQLGWRRADAYALTNILRQEAGGGRVLALSPGIAPVFPALNYANVRMTLRAMNIWLLEGLYRDCPAGNSRYRDFGDMSGAEVSFYVGVIADFTDAPPDAVVIDNFSAIPVCDGISFNLLDYFNRDPSFAATWASYVEVGRHGRFAVFARRPRSPPR